MNEQVEAGRPFRGVGEPVYPERGAEELVECGRHEELLNLEFASGPPWRLLCPYDVTALDPAVLDEARRNHPWLLDVRGRVASATWKGLEVIAEPFDRALPEPAGVVHACRFNGADLVSVRAFVAEQAKQQGLAAGRIDDLVLSVSEVASNSVRHGGGGGEVRMWVTGGALITEVRDAGLVADPLVGRHRPNGSGASGYGLWIVNQLCDLVQIRSLPNGSIVRLHMSLG